MPVLVPVLGPWLALYYANNSLRTASVQPEMIRMRDSLGSSSHAAWNRNMQRRILDREIDLAPAGDLTPAPVDPDFDPSASTGAQDATSGVVELPRLEEGTETGAAGFGEAPTPVTRATTE